MKMSKTKIIKHKAKAHGLKFLVFSFTFALFALHFTLVFAQQPINSAELINNAQDYDGKKIIFEGEIIGDVMSRGNFAWINVNQADNAIGIWLTKALCSQIKFCGGYNKKGDWVKIEGVFNRACYEHGGDLDIHAVKLTVLNRGRVVKEIVPEDKKKLAIYLGGVCLCLLMLQFYLVRQKKKLITA